MRFKAGNLLRQDALVHLLKYMIELSKGFNLYIVVIAPMLCPDVH